MVYSYDNYKTNERIVMKKYLLATTIVLLLTGCASTTKTVVLKNDFNEKDAEFINKTGNNTIKGNAFFRQQGGGIVTCAGNTVVLIPVTPYSKERMSHIYKFEDIGVIPPYMDAISFDKGNNEYLSMTKNTKCDSDGKFEFNNLANGEYYVVSSVIWKVRSYQGGTLMRKVSVKNGKTENIVMTL